MSLNFYSGFVVPEAAPQAAATRADLKAKYPNPAAYARTLATWSKSYKMPRGTIGDVVADHSDHIVKVAGIDHIGIGSDIDGITSWLVGLEDVSCYPRFTEELVRRGYSEADIHKILGGNVLRVFREGGQVAERLRKTTNPEIDHLLGPTGRLGVGGDRVRVGRVEKRHPAGRSPRRGS